MQLCLKSKELEDSFEQIKKIDGQRKRYAETSKIFEGDVACLREEKLKLCKKIDEINEILKETIEELINEKNKSLNAESNLKGVESYKTEIIMLNECIGTLKKENAALKSEAALFQNGLSLKKNKWREKKVELKDKIFDLENRVFKEKNSITAKIAEAFRAKRSSTIKHIESAQMLTGESIFKLQAKIGDLESNLSASKTEQEKLFKSIEYYKSQLDNKSHIITVLESKVSNEHDNNKIQIIQDEARDVSIFIKVLEDSMAQNIDDLKCKKCFERRSVEFIIIPCEHMICRNCMSYEENCPLCSTAGRICEFAQWKKIMDRMIFQAEKVNAIKKTLILHL